MTSRDELLRLVERLRKIEQWDGACRRFPDEEKKAIEEAAAAIRGLLEQKPVAWFFYDPDDGGEWNHIADNAEEAASMTGVVPLYAEPVAAPAQTRSQKLAAAGFTRRPSLRALEMQSALQLIATPMRPDGSWNRDREACRQLAAEALGKYEDAAPAQAETDYEAFERSPLELNVTGRGTATLRPAQAESHTGIYCPSCGTAIAARWLTQNDVQEPPVQLSLDLDTP